MAPPTRRSVSFRSQINGELHDFLEYEGFECASTTSALVALVACLSRYTEEGISLAPIVLMSDDLGAISESVPESRMIQLGSCDRSDEAPKQILKECAPLAAGGWAIFLERDDQDKFRYGVIYTSPEFTKPSKKQSLVEDKSQDCPIVMVRQIAEGCVELAGAKGNQRVLHFSAARAEEKSLDESQISLAKSISKTRLTDEGTAFFSRFFEDTLPKTHGCLIVVMRNGEQAPEELQDGKMLDPPIDLIGSIETLREFNDLDAFARLESETKLLQGMLACDGILVFDDAGKILGYRVFLRTQADTGTSVIGGARRRTFAGLKALVDQEKLSAVFVRSHDGDAEFYEVN